MEQLTLQQLFGNSASQDSQQLIISKADLPKLTASADNTAESLLTALILQAHNNWQGNIIDENSKEIITETDEVIGYNLPQDFYEKLNVFSWKRQFFKGMILDTFVIEVFK